MNKCTLSHTINKGWNMIQKSKVKIVNPLTWGLLLILMVAIKTKPQMLMIFTTKYLHKVYFSQIKKSHTILIPFRSTWMHPPVARWARILFCLVFCVVFCRSLFIVLSFLCWSLYCLSFFDHHYVIFKPLFKCVFIWHHHIYHSKYT